MLCTLQTYKHIHITVLQCAENWKVQQSVTRYTGSIEKNKVYIHNGSLSNFELFFAFIFVQKLTQHIKQSKEWF